MLVNTGPEVDKYFQHLESVAQNFKWHTDLWPLLLQGVLKQKPKRHLQL